MMNFEDDKKFEFELYKFRAAEYGKRYESMRQLEWKVTFQLYVAYAALAVCFFRLHEKHPSSKAIGWFAVIFTMILYFSGFYLNLRIQERLRYTRDIQNRYAGAMHSLLNVQKLDRPEINAILHHKYNWAWYVQTILSTCTAVGIISYAVAVSLCSR